MATKDRGPITAGRANVLTTENQIAHSKLMYHIPQVWNDIYKAIESGYYTTTVTIPVTSDIVSDPSLIRQVEEMVIELGMYLSGYGYGTPSPVYVNVALKDGSGTRKIKNGWRVSWGEDHITDRDLMNAHIEHDISKKG